LRTHSTAQSHNTTITVCKIT